MFEFFVPTKVSIQSVENGFQRLFQLKKQSILLICSENRLKQFEIKKGIERLKKENKVFLIQRKLENPTVELLYEEINKISEPFHHVISIGGGSSIDLAKGIIALCYLTDDEKLSLKKVEESIRRREYLNFPSNINHIAIPTTAGTGSEITPWATVWNPPKQEKLSIDAPWLFPISAIVIPELTISLPKRLTLSTALDALNHAAESHWSKKSTFLTRELSRSAIKKIVTVLPKVLEEPEAIKYRREMCEGVILASVAFSNTRTAACHSISYPLTMRYGVEHGFAVSVTMVEVMKENHTEIPEWEEFLQAFGRSSIQEIKRWLLDLCAPIQRLDLKSLGVPKEEIKHIAEESFTAGRMDNNIAEFTKDKVEKILEACYEMGEQEWQTG